MSLPRPVSALSLPLLLVAVLPLVGGCARLPAPPPFEGLHQPPRPENLKPAKIPDAQRFDFLVRDDFFYGIDGNAEAFDRAMALCERTLAANPRHAEAMAWYGSGLLFRSGQAFTRNDGRRGAALWTQALTTLDAAVTLAPDEEGVLIPVAAALHGAGMNMPERMARPYLQLGVTAYEKVMQVQQKYFADLSAHARGEVLLALAEGHARLGNTSVARRYFERLRDEAQDPSFPEYGAIASAWLASGARVTRSRSCVGCHVE